MCEINAMGVQDRYYAGLAGAVKGADGVTV
jgi:hypothetical protein